MEQIVVYSRLGVVKYDIPSMSPLISPVSAKLQRQHMANDYVQVSLETNEILSLSVGDYIEVRGCRYSIRSMSDVTRSGEDAFQYNVTFFGAMYNLMRYKYRNSGINGKSDQNTFDLTMTLKGFVKVIINNVMRAEGIEEEVCESSPWLFDEESCPSKDPITMSFDQHNCLTALQCIVQEFDVEFLITQEFNEDCGVWQCTIHVGTFGDVVNSTPFEYGQGNGLYQLQENKVDDSTIVNRLWAEGSTENILFGYRGYSMRLQLPRRSVPLLNSGHTERRSRNQHTIEINGEKYIFDAGYPIGIPDEASRYVDESVLYYGSNDIANGKWKMQGEDNWRYAPFTPDGLCENYGILEDSCVFDDIMPSPTFQIKSIPSDNSRLKFVCDVDFDLSAKWTQTYDNFLEWCLLKTQVVPSMAEYEECIYFDSHNEFDSDGQGVILGWSDYKSDYGSNLTTDPYTQWRQQHHSASAPALPVISQSFKQEVYEQYCIYKDVVAGNNSKYLIEGGSVAFVNGKLAGIEFPIVRATYNSTTHRSTITIDIKQEPDTGDVFPSEDEFGAFRFAINDKFKLVNIYFPYEYYEDAEEELWFAAYEKFESIKYPSLQYKLTFDNVFISENKPIFEAIQTGDYITITDTRLGISNKKIRVSQIDVDILNNIEYQITLENTHRHKIRSGQSVRQAEEIWEALRDANLDDVRYRNNNRTSGSRAVSYITENGCIRDNRISNQFVSERMIGNGVITSVKIANKAITTSLLADNAVTANQIKAGEVSIEKLEPYVALKINNSDEALNNRESGIKAIRDAIDKIYDGVNGLSIEGRIVVIDKPAWRNKDEHTQ